MITMRPEATPLPLEAAAKAPSACAVHALGVGVWSVLLAVGLCVVPACGSTDGSGDGDEAPFDEGEGGSDSTKPPEDITDGSDDGDPATMTGSIQHHGIAFEAKYGAGFRSGGAIDVWLSTVAIGCEAEFMDRLAEGYYVKLEVGGEEAKAYDVGLISILGPEKLPVEVKGQGPITISSLDGGRVKGAADLVLGDEADGTWFKGSFDVKKCW